MSEHIRDSMPRRTRRPLPALAMPKGREDRRAGALFSVFVHVLVIALLIAPFAAHQAIIEREQGAGGPGPAGGGGGGRRGTGGEQRQATERLRYIVVTPTAVPTPTSVPPPVPQVTPPVVPPPKPVEEKKPEPVPEAKPQEIPARAAPDVSVTPGRGGGTGADGTAGSGPGSGGGVGSGVGTGRGSGVGPGTGGGTQANHPPRLMEMFIPPMPIPDRVRPFHGIAEFDVDERGRVLSFDFTPTRDGDYNKKLREVFRSYRFLPGMRPDGTPIRMKTQLEFDF